MSESHYTTESRHAREGYLRAVLFSNGSSRRLASDVDKSGISTDSRLTPSPLLGGPGGGGGCVRNLSLPRLCGVLNFDFGLDWSRAGGASGSATKGKRGASGDCGEVAEWVLGVTGHYSEG